MDTDENLANNFADSLRHCNEKQFVALYRETSSQFRTNSIHVEEYKIKDVISDVSKQLKAIQIADSVKKYKSAKVISESLKNTHFLPVHKVPFEHQPKQNKFETQLVLDTQFINIIENAEAMIDQEKEILKEFDTTFCHKDINDCDSGKNIQEQEHLSDTEDENIPLTQTNFEIDNCKAIKLSSLDEAIPNISFHDEILIAPNVDTRSKNVDISDSLVVQSNCSFVTNDDHPSEDTIDNLNTESNNESKSPIIFNKMSLRVKSMSDWVSPLVYRLESFEKFETIALPIVTENYDFETAKKVINSQIMNKKLCIQTCREPVVTDKDKKFNSGIGKYSNQKLNSIKEDTILFSSDEEGDIQNNLDELPLTCALKSSCYNKPEILDETIYMGFQTASNKCIQVSFNSFSKAKSIFNNITKIANDSVTNYVEGVETKIDTSLTTKNDNTTDEDIFGCFESSNVLENNDIVSNDKNNNSSNIVLNSVIDEKKEMNDNFVQRNNNNLVDDFKKHVINGNYKLEDINTDLMHKRKRKTEELYEINETDVEKSFLKSVHVEVTNINETQISELESAIKDKSLNNVNEKLKQETITVIQCDKQIDMCKYTKETSLGFRTANNKMIKVSAQAFMKTKNIFENTDGEFAEILQDNNTKYLKSISNKAIKTSENALVKCNNIFHNINTQESKGIEKNKIVTENFNTSNHTGGNIMFQGFKTASNKPVQISESALAKTKNIFEGIDIEKHKMVKDDVSVLKQTTHYTASGLSFQGFKTASNKPVQISESALAKTKNIFEDINVEETKTVTDKYNTNKPSGDNKFSDSMCQGFKTASNKPVQISKSALAKTKNIFEGIDIEKHNMLKDDVCILKHTAHDTACSLNLQGFKTASNKPIQISESALAKTKNLFEDINIEETKTVTDKHNTSKQTGGNTFSDSMFQGFKTANNKPVQMSVRAMTKTKNIFKIIEYEENKMIKDDVCVLKQTTHDTASGLTFQGFKTASNKPVQISESALAKTKNIFEDINVAETKTVTDKYNTNKSPGDNKFSDSMFQGFKTASNKLVEISESALAKTKIILKETKTDDFHTVKHSSNNKVSDNTIRSFKTASDKPVQISESALAKTKNVFEGIVIEESRTEADDFCSSKRSICISGSMFQGFKTASNKSVQISAENLAKSKKIFEHMDIEFDEKQKSDVKENVIKDSILYKSSCALDFKTGNDITISEEALKQTGFFSARGEHLPANRLGSKLKAHTITDTQIVESFDTEIAKDFENTVCTEDFLKNETPKSKRSGSPILSCPKAKKRKKFETPISSKKFMTPSNTVRIVEPTNMYKYSENYKKKKTITLNDVNEIEKLRNNVNIDPYIFNFQFETLLDFHFYGVRNDIDNDIWTTDKITTYFINSVNRKIIPQGWIQNHLKLIIWKLISYEIRFPYTMKNICTVKNVLEQLKYRYERELYNVERPALRKILERDEVSIKRMILCVASILVDGVSVSSVANQTQNIELILTDGWYTIKASTDQMIDKLVCDGKIGVGVKLVIHGAELLNCEQGISPWEDISSVRLKLFGNSTKRAKWSARLGFHGNGAILSHLSDVKPEGGKISQLRVFVTRVYPTLYIEKFPDGSTVTRSERLEHIHQMKYETERQIQMEKLYEEVEKFSDQESQDSDGQHPGNRAMDSGSQISRLMKRSRDLEEFRANLTSTQAHLLQRHTMEHKDRLLQALQDKVQELMKTRGLDVGRNVVPLMKMRIADVHTGNTTKAMVTIWRPNESLQEMLAEGMWIDLYNVVPTSVRYSEVQISAGRQSVFRKSKLKETEKLRTHIQILKRQCYTIKNLQNTSMNTDYNEVDTVGLVFLIEPNSKEFEITKQLFQNVYLTDADKNIICVNFWGGVKKFGFESILDTGQVITCVNLQKRAGNTRKNIPQFRATEFSYFTKTSKNETVRKMADDLAEKFNTLDRRKFIDDCVALKTNYHNIKNGNTENVSPYRLNTSDYNIYKNKVFIDSPLANKCADVNYNLNGLDFESSFKQTDINELSPQTLLRKKQVNERIAKLKMYGEPPPLSPIHIINKSSNTIKPFKSPYMKNDLLSSVASSKANASEIYSGPKPNELPLYGEEHKIDSSPVMGLNRTYVKRASINPVKLNFSNIMEEQCNGVTDPFAEEFEGSLPLSFD